MAPRRLVPAQVAESARLLDPSETTFVGERGDGRTGCFRAFLVAATVRSPSDPRGRGTPARRRPPSPVVNVRSAERRFLDEFLVMLADGFKMRKHGRRSRAA